MKVARLVSQTTWENEITRLTDASSLLASLLEYRVLKTKVGSDVNELTSRIRIQPCVCLDLGLDAGQACFAKDAWEFLSNLEFFSLQSLDAVDPSRVSSLGLFAIPFIIWII